MADSVTVEIEKLKRLAKIVKSKTEVPTLNNVCCMPTRGFLLGCGYFKLVLLFAGATTVLTVGVVNFIVERDIWPMLDVVLPVGLLLLYILLDLVFTNVMLVGVHSKHVRSLQVSQHSSAGNALALAGAYVALVALPVADVLRNQGLDSTDAVCVLAAAAAALAYLVMNIFMAVAVRSLVHQLNSSEVNYEQLNEDPEVQGITLPNSGNYYLVSKVSPSSAPPRFVIRKFAGTPPPHAEVTFTPSKSLFNAVEV